MRYLFEFLMVNGTITGGEYESDEVIQKLSNELWIVYPKSPCTRVR